MKILIADDENKVRSALKLMVEQIPGFELVGEAAVTGDLLVMAAEIRPDVILLDCELAGGRGPGLVSEVLAASPRAVVVAMTGRPENKVPILEAGASYFITKNDPPERLLGILADIGKISKCS